MILFICSHCNDEKPSLRSLRAHRPFCSQNPNKSSNLKGGVIQKKKAEHKYKEYYQNPKLCSVCKDVLPFAKKEQLFCSHTCSNKGRPKDFKFGPKPKPIHLKSVSAKIFRKTCKSCNTLFITPNESRYCSDACRHKIWSTTAKNNPKMGGNKNNKAYGWYESPYAGKVFLESSWEYIVAKDLDANCIRWNRPKYFHYDGSKKYFPDFYLPDYNVYLDPKNPYLQTIDSAKINSVMEQHGIKIFILSKTELSWSSILTKIRSVSIDRDAIAL